MLVESYQDAIVTIIRQGTYAVSQAKSFLHAEYRKDWLHRKFLAAYLSEGKNV